MSFSSNELIHGIRTDNREPRDKSTKKRWIQRPQHDSLHRDHLEKTLREMQLITYIPVCYFFLLPPNPIITHPNPNLDFCGAIWPI